jgi:hypothetical protein
MTLKGLPMTSRRPKRPRDPNQLAKLIVDLATGAASEEIPEAGESGKDPAAVSLGRRGGLKGGRARAASLTPEQRIEIAKKAAAKRWNH